MKKVEIKIKGMSCGGCTKKVEESLRDEIRDIKNVIVSLSKNEALAEDRKSVV